MNKEQFLLELIENEDNILTDHTYQVDLIGDLLDIGFSYMNLHFERVKDRTSNLMFQIALCKVHSIIKLSEGMNFNYSGVNISGLTDIQSISSVFRSLFENYCFFHHLFIRNWSKDNFTLINNIWQISSLNQRRSILKGSILLKEENIALKTKKEVEHIEKLKNEIKALEIYQKNKKYIHECFSKNKWQITISGGKILYISWKEMYENATKSKSKRYKSTYQTLSLDTHPSYLAVLHFGELYKERCDLNRRGTRLYQTIEMLAKYIYDFQTLIKEDENLIVNRRGFHAMNFFGNPNYSTSP